MESRQKSIFQIFWGVLLSLAGVGLLFRIPGIMLEIEQIGSFSSSKVFIRICFYFIAALLIGGGVKKIRHNYKNLSDNDRLSE
jgi:choline-glycine betaine transporter